MVGAWGYPKSLISVEKAVKTRRYDVLVHARKTLKPLLLIECKAEKLTEAAKIQALGYNETIGAPFISLVSANEILTFWYEGSELISVPFLPKYDELYAAMRIRV
jgi:hypothetical protein